MNVISATLCYNTPDLAEAMRAQLPGLLVIDNGSQPFLPGSVVRTPMNRMFAGGWNAGMKTLAQWDIDAVLMANSDTDGWTPQTIDLLARVMESAGYAVVTPAFNSPHALFHPVAGRSIRPVSWIDWTCPLVSMAAWRDVGPFDEQFSGYYADIDWCKRARDRGYRFAVCDAVTVRHLGSVTAQRIGHIWDADDSRLCAKWGVRHWTEMVG